jgi:hypothetical protein
LRINRRETLTILAALATPPTPPLAAEPAAAHPLPLPTNINPPMPLPTLPPTTVCRFDDLA